MNITRIPGTYAYKATSATGTASWEGSFTVVAGKCTGLELVLTAVSNSACAGWRQRYGGFHDDELRKVLPLADGGFLLAGKSKSTIESGSRYTRKSLNAILGIHGGVDDLWITRVGTDGKALWDIGLDIYHKERLGVATIGNEFLDIIQTRDGGFAMVGKKSDSLRLFKVSANGSFLWAKTFISPAGYVNSFIRQTPTGDLLIGAGQSSQVSTPKIMCLRADGSIRWEQFYSITSLTVSNITFDNALPTPDGGYICTAPIDADKTVAVKIDGSGNKLWEKLLPGGRVTGEAPDGSFLLVDDEDTGGVNSHPYAPFYVPLGARAIRVDQNGTIVWDRFVRSKKSVNTKKIDSFHTATYADGNYLIGGVINDNGEPLLWLLKLDIDGNVKWEMMVDEDTGYQFINTESRYVMYTSVSNILPTADGGFFIGATQSEKFYATPIDPASYPGLNFLGIKVKACSLNNGRLAAPAPLRPAH